MGLCKHRLRKGAKEMLRRKNKKAKEVKNTRPDICLSLDCDNMEELKAEIEKYKDYCRYVEWQMDKVAEKPFFNKEFFIGAIWEIKRQFPGKKIMISYRGAGPKGSRILNWAIDCADMVCIKYNDPTVRELLRSARIKGTPSIVSFRSFNKMPSREDLATIYVKMERLGGDILELACFAENEVQTYAILQAAESYQQLRNHKPLIVVAMGEEGQASRVCAGDFGSIITYACGSQPTAPGQINARDLSKYLDIYYERK